MPSRSQMSVACLSSALPRPFPGRQDRYRSAAGTSAAPWDGSSPSAASAWDRRPRSPDRPCVPSAHRSQPHRALRRAATTARRLPSRCDGQCPCRRPHHRTPWRNVGRPRRRPWARATSSGSPSRLKAKVRMAKTEPLRPGRRLDAVLAIVPRLGATIQRARLPQPRRIGLRRRRELERTAGEGDDDLGTAGDAVTIGHQGLDGRGSGTLTRPAPARSGTSIIPLSSSVGATPNVRMIAWTCNTPSAGAARSSSIPVTSPCSAYWAPKLRGTLSTT